MAVNLLFQAELFNSYDDLYAFVQARHRFGKVCTKQRLCHDQDTSILGVLGKLLYILKDNMILGIDVMLRKTKLITITNEVLMEHILRSCGVHRIFLYVKFKNQMPFYVFAELHEGKFCCDGRYMPWFNKEARYVTFIPDITAIQELYEAEVIEIYGLHQEYVERMTKDSTLV